VGLAAQLAHGLDDLGDAAAVGRVVVAQAAAVGVPRQRAAARHQVAVLHEGAALPFLQKPRSSSCRITMMVKLS
jgi:hypothetical protein